MSGFLSSISGQFAKPVIFGMMFPVVIILALNAAFVLPVVPLGMNLSIDLQKIPEAAAKGTVLTFVVLFVTGLLYILNIPIIRLYEGYPWEKSLVGSWLVRRSQKRFSNARDLRRILRSLKRNLQVLDPNSPELKALQTRQTSLARILLDELPSAENLILPTRLGNVIRSFELYPMLAYGMDAIVLWPRLVAKIEGTFASTIDDAKSMFDFALNCSFLSGLTALVLLGALGFHPHLLASRWNIFWRAVAYAFGSVVAYELSINRAAAWGQRVRSAFDLYRGELLKALGYTRVPASPDEEQLIWAAINNQIQFADVSTPHLPYAEPPTRAVASPAGVGLSLARSMGGLNPNGTIDVRVELQNTDVGRRTAERVRVIDSLSDGMKYVPGSVSVDVPGRTVTVVTTKPLELSLDSIAVGIRLVITYTLRPAA